MDDSTRFELAVVIAELTRRWLLPWTDHPGEVTVKVPVAAVDEEPHSRRCQHPEQLCLGAQHRDVMTASLTRGVRLEPQRPPVGARHHGCFDHMLTDLA
jgi:hypothetical protein